MKVAVVLTLATVAMGSVLRERSCNADNCARQVTGTRPGLLPITQRQDDCSSYMLSTVTPSPTTITVTVEGGGAAKHKRDDDNEAAEATEVPSEVPAYASSCNESRYASVCDCWGITAEVTTAPTPTETVTTTIDYCEDL